MIQPPIDPPEAFDDPQEPDWERKIDEWQDHEDYPEEFSDWRGEE